MGNELSRPLWAGQHHPVLFYKGCEAVIDGRYTLSNVYFVQALERHPGHSFWTHLTHTIVTSPVKDASMEDCSADTNVEGSVKGKAELSVPRCRLSYTSPTRITLPTGRHLTDIVDYIRLVSDMAVAYGHQANCTSGPCSMFSRRLGISFAKYAVARVHVLWELLRTYLAASGGLGGKSEGASSSTLSTFGGGGEKRPATTRRCVALDAHVGDSAMERIHLAAVCQSCFYYFLSNLIAYVVGVVILLQESGGALSRKQRTEVDQNVLLCSQLMERYCRRSVEGRTSIHVAALTSRFLNAINDLPGLPKMEEVEAIVSLYIADLNSGNGTDNASSSGSGSTSFKAHVLFRSLRETFMTTFRQSSLVDLLTPPLAPCSAWMCVELDMADFAVSSGFPSVLLPTKRDTFRYLLPLLQFFAGREPQQVIPGNNTFLLKHSGMMDPFHICDASTFCFAAMEEVALLTLCSAIVKMRILVYQDERQQANAVSQAIFAFCLTLHGGGSQSSQMVNAALQKVGRM